MMPPASGSSFWTTATSKTIQEKSETDTCLKQPSVSNKLNLVKYTQSWFSKIREHYAPVNRKKFKSTLWWQLEIYNTKVKANHLVKEISFNVNTSEKRVFSQMLSIKTGKLHNSKRLLSPTSCNLFSQSHAATRLFH